MSNTITKCDQTAKQLAERSEASNKIKGEKSVCPSDFFPPHMIAKQMALHDKISDEAPAGPTTARAGGGNDDDNGGSCGRR